MAIEHNNVPLDVTGEIERLVRGEGRFAESDDERFRDIELKGLEGEASNSAIETLQGLMSDLTARLEAVEQSALAIEPDIRKPELLSDDDNSFWAQITASAADGDNRFSYTFAEVSKSSAGYGGWATLSDGRSGTARNVIEDGNDAQAATVLGNGIIVSHLDTGDWTFTFEEVPDNVYVRIWTVSVGDTDNTVEYWFQYENGADGECD